MSDAFIGSHNPYLRSKLELEDLQADPVLQLADWLNEAEQAGCIEPNAMCLATTDAKNRARCRMVLMRGLGADGLRFFTNYESDKAEELWISAQASVCFWWPSLERQVRVEGAVEKLSPEISDAYFASRPLDSQAASASSPQSREIKGREQVEQAMAELMAQHPAGIPRPAHWGGYLLAPDRFEFWQGRPARLHDRFVYQLSGGEWRVSRLAP
jgi:pyridoxamine 5'-phosphate oxidase